MKNLPTAAWVCLTAAFLGVLGMLGFLSYTDSDATEFSRFLNTAVNLATLLLGGGALAYSARAQQQTNGDLDARIEDAAARALAAQRDVDTQPGGELRR